MKRKFKSSHYLLIAIFLVFTLFLNSCADSNATKRFYENGLEFQINEDGETCTVTHNVSNDDDYLLIPTTVEYKSSTYKITAIGVDSFCESTMTSLAIPDSVVDIQKQAFTACPNLKTVNFGNGVKTIGESAFKQCKSLTTVVIPDSVLTIGEYAFDNCTSLTSIKISDSVTTIGDFAISGCKSLSEIKLGNNITKIGKYAFAKSIITSISIPDSVTFIGEKAFFGCESLETVNLGNGVQEIDTSAFSHCESLKDVYYSGSEEDWNKINLLDDNEYLTSATIHFNS